MAAYTTSTETARQRKAMHGIAAVAAASYRARREMSTIDRLDYEIHHESARIEAFEAKGLPVSYERLDSLTDRYEKAARKAAKK